ncbi:MAG: hypothetical protein CM1200mP10_14880 [Candidatus Neomarinimicrobiota bacterium]|nr:MAG: hypothetical protein CM1200mP10_14880 [Candidatus Neomarinimicrobiota bacterium]
MITAIALLEGLMIEQDEEFECAVYINLVTEYLNAGK